MSVIIWCHLIDEEEEEDLAFEDDDGDADWGEDDDPDKLWCLCRQPYNNRQVVPAIPSHNLLQRLSLMSIFVGLT